MLRSGENLSTRGFWRQTRTLARGVLCNLARDRGRGSDMEGWINLAIAVVATAVPAVVIAVLLAYKDHKRDLKQRI